MKFTTSDLCDAFPAAVRVAQPAFKYYGGASRFAGPIDTLQVFEDNGLVAEVLDTAGRGRVLVLDGGGSIRTALVGGRLAKLAHTNGWAGLLVNGACAIRSRSGRFQWEYWRSPLRPGGAAKLVMANREEA